MVTLIHLFVHAYLLPEPLNKLVEEDVCDSFEEFAVALADRLSHRDVLHAEDLLDASDVDLAHVLHQQVVLSEALDLLLRENAVVVQILHVVLYVFVVSDGSHIDQVRG